MKKTPLRQLFEEFKDAKPGDTITIAGVPVKLGTDEECEKAEVHICMRTADMPTTYLPSMKGVCSKCGAQIWISLDSPVKPPKICQVCAMTYMDENQTLTE